MFALHVILGIVWFISGIGSSICVLAHSGDGMGVSDVIGLRMGDTGASSGIVEKNLDKLTVICVCVFVATLVLLAFFWPQAPVMQALPVAASE